MMKKRHDRNRRRKIADWTKMCILAFCERRSDKQKALHNT